MSIHIVHIPSFAETDAVSDEFVTDHTAPHLYFVHVVQLGPAYDLLSQQGKFGKHMKGQLQMRQAS